VHPLPKVVGLPHFGHRKFDNYTDFNRWKKDLLDQIAAAEGVKWTK
jgi:hypothetical protein